MKTLYELHWHNVNDTLCRYSVTPIQVTKELPFNVIEARGSDGRSFIGHAVDYYETGAMAWEAAHKNLKDTLKVLRARAREIDESIQLAEKMLENQDDPT